MKLYIVLSVFYPRFYPLHLFSYLNSWERASIFPFECWVLNEGTTGTIFMTSLVWRGPWLWIEPGTSHTRSQHYTTRLSRRRYSCSKGHDNHILSPITSVCVLGKINESCSQCLQWLNCYKYIHVDSILTQWGKMIHQSAVCEFKCYKYGLH